MKSASNAAFSWEKATFYLEEYEESLKEVLGAEFVDRDFESHVGNKIERNEKNNMAQVE